jgi:hypothetical protein
MVCGDIGTIFTMVGEATALAHNQDGKLMYWGSMARIGLRGASS